MQDAKKYLSFIAHKTRACPILTTSYSLYNTALHAHTLEFQIRPNRNVWISTKKDKTNPFFYISPKFKRVKPGREVETRPDLIISRYKIHSNYNMKTSCTVD